MAKFSNPQLFSKVFRISKSYLDSKGAFDPILNVDTKLFIDPLLLPKSSLNIFRNKATKTFRDFFSDLVTLLISSNSPIDAPGREAVRRFKFNEMKGTCLGYGATSIKGRGIGPQLQRRMLNTARQIISLGVKDPKMFLLLPLLEEDVGPDLISDMTTNIIIGEIARYTKEVLKSKKIKLERFRIKGKIYELPENPIDKRTPVLLVPKDILRELPLASSWEDVGSVAAENEQTRKDINTYIGEIWKGSNRKDKKALRERVLASKNAFNTLLNLMTEVDLKSYDFASDPSGLNEWLNVRETIAQKHPLKIRKEKITLNSGYEVVKQIVKQFRKLVEDNRLNKLLWHKRERRPEKAAQLLFFAVADSYCITNDLDLSPETDSGPGPVDFKISSGYKKRVLVEIKLSTNSQLYKGFKKQLEFYKKAEKTCKAIYLVVDVENDSKKMEKKALELTKIRNEWSKNNGPVSDLEFVDGNLKPSASKS